MLDVALNHNSSTTCDGASRRDFLRVGGLTAFGLSLPTLLHASDQAPTTSRKRNRARSVILVYLGGGLSHHDSFDMKPDAPAEIRGKYRPIASNVTGLQVGELLPQMAKTMDKVCLIRSGAHNNDHHETATNWVMSGRFGSAFGDYPAIGAVVAHETGFSGSLPPYVSVPRGTRRSLGNSGKKCFPRRPLRRSFKAGDPSQKDFKVQDVAPAEAISAKRAVRRQSLLEAVDGLARKVQANDQIATYDEFRQRASTMILSGEARRAFDVDDEPEKLRDRYGRTTFGQSCLLARRLIAGGVRFVTVNFGGWDHHAKIWDGLQNKLPDFDRGFSSLIHDLDDRGLLSETLVVAMGEFGRTPKINKDTGRDHWAPAGSLLLAGGGEAWQRDRSNRQARGLCDEAASCAG